MKLKDAIRNGKSAADSRGFRLLTPEMERFHSLDAFHQAVSTQAKNTTRLNADFMRTIDLEGRIEEAESDGLRLSKAAFADLCHFSQVPVSFVRKLAKEDETLALDLIKHRIKVQFQTGEEKVLVIDKGSGRIEGIVGKDTYKELSNAAVLEYVLSANDGLEMSNAWLEGPKARMTFIDKTKPFEAAVGDIVHTGTSIWTGINGDSAVNICDYNERLVCLNGMTARDRVHSERVIHRGDVEFNVQAAVMRSADRAKTMVPMMQAATHQVLDTPDIRRIRSFISNPRNNGTPSLDERVSSYALTQSQRGGRDEGVVTLWDFVNGVTEAAHDARTIHRRGEVETLGYRVLSDFVSLN
jgi:CBS domain-containing protein